jgi:hypothetical protein
MDREIEPIDQTIIMIMQIDEKIARIETKAEEQSKTIFNELQVIKQTLQGNGSEGVCRAVTRHDEQIKHYSDLIGKHEHLKLTGIGLGFTALGLLIAFYH